MTELFGPPDSSPREPAQPDWVSAAARPGLAKMSLPESIIELDFEEPMHVDPRAEVSGMCDSEGQPASVTDALGMLDRALGYLATADTAALPASVQADALLALAKAEAQHTAARRDLP